KARFGGDQNGGPTPAPRVRNPVSAGYEPRIAARPMKHRSGFRWGDGVCVRWLGAGPEASSTRPLLDGALFGLFQARQRGGEGFLGGANRLAVGTPFAARSNELGALGLQLVPRFHELGAGRGQLRFEVLDALVALVDGGQGGVALFRARLQLRGQPFDGGVTLGNRRARCIPLLGASGQSGLQGGDLGELCVDGGARGVPLLGAGVEFTFEAR